MAGIFLNILNRKGHKVSRKERKEMSLLAHHSSLL